MIFRQQLMSSLFRRCGALPAGALSGEYLPGHTSMGRRDPLGVVASIAPWITR